MKNKKIVLLFVLLLAILLICFHISQPIKIKIISFNDFHGALESKNEVGIAKFVNAVKRETIKGKTIVVSAGDNFTGEGLSNIFYGKPVAEIFKTINVAASVLGNHEFDWGIDKIPMWENEMQAPFISANIKTKDGNYLVKPYIIKKINGVRIGFIGLTTLETKFKTARKNTENLEFLDPVETAMEMVKELKNQNVDIIILLTHIGTFQNEETGEIVFETEKLKELTKIHGVDAIITAHFHEKVMGLVNGVPVVQSSHRGRIITVIEFDRGRFSKKIHRVAFYQKNLLEVKDNLKGDREALKILEKYRKNASLIFDAPLIELKEPLGHGRDGLSPLGDFVCKTLNAATNSEITIINGGSIRNGLNSGNITMGNIYETMPFDSIGVKINILGKNLRNAIINNSDSNMQFHGFKIEKGKIILNNGEILRDEKIYTVLINDFMLENGDRYNFTDCEVVEELDTIRDLFIRGL